MSMYYIVELADGTQFATDFLENLPEDAVGFTQVCTDRLTDKGYPTNYQVRLGRVYHTEDGIDKAYFNGGVIIANESTGYVRTYEELNKTFRDTRIWHDVMTR